MGKPGGDGGMSTEVIDFEVECERVREDSGGLPRRTMQLVSDGLSDLRERRGGACWARPGASRLAAHGQPIACVSDSEPVRPDRTGGVASRPQHVSEVEAVDGRWREDQGG